MLSSDYGYVWGSAPLNKQWTTQWQAIHSSMPLLSPLSPTLYWHSAPSRKLAHTNLFHPYHSSLSAKSYESLPKIEGKRTGNPKLVAWQWPQNQDGDTRWGVSPQSQKIVGGTSERWIMDVLLLTYLYYSLREQTQDMLLWVTGNKKAETIICAAYS